MTATLINALQKCYNITPIEYFRRYSVYEGPINFPCATINELIDYWYNHIIPNKPEPEDRYQQLTKGTFGYRVLSIYDLYNEFVNSNSYNKHFKFDFFDKTIRKIITNHDPIKLDCFPFPELFKYGHVIVCLYTDRDGNDKISYINPLAKHNINLFEQDIINKCVNNSEFPRLYYMMNKLHNEFDNLYDEMKTEIIKEYENNSK